MTEPVRTHVAIVGAGFAGLGAAVRLEQAGEHDFVVLEKADDVGGTWRENTYPGIECDVPSNLYSFSFAPNPNWTRSFSPGGEIWHYLRDCAQRFGIMERIRFGTEVQRAAWDDAAQRWRLETSQGPVEAQILIAGAGPLHDPKYPDIPGLDRFKGRAFHSALWDHAHDLTGERVAVIGTGASAIQFVPAIQPNVAELHLFQRTPAWVIPRHNRHLSALEHRAYRLLPPLQKLVRGVVYWSRELMVLPMMHPRLGRFVERRALRHLEQQVSDPVLREKLTPRYPIGCKRILISNEYFPAVAAPNVELVTDAIKEVRAHSIVDANGVERAVDTIVYGTGFHVTDMPVARIVHGADGRTLEEVWNGTPEGYLGTTVHGFPNLFLLVGPNAGLGHTSIVFMIESQLNYVIDAVRAMRRRGVGSVEVRAEVQAAFNADVQRRLVGTVWTSGCASWYVDRNGKVSTLWPGGTWRYRQATRRFDVDEYVLRPQVPRAVPVAA